MTAPILVTGGTGTLGRHVVRRLREAGRDVRVLSRRGGAPAEGVAHVTADLVSGEGIDAAVAGVETVMHLAGGPKGDDISTRNLVGAAKAAGVAHIVYISVIGADRTPVVSGIDRAMFGYVAAKRESERIIAESGVPFTILRASQFHDLMLTMAEQMGKLPVVPVPAGMKAQPIETAEVADRLVELALGAPAGRVPDIAGPRVYPLGELIGGYLKATGKRRPMLKLPMPGRAARAFREGANLAPDRAVGKRTWEAFLAERVG
jgi:uncharacterized protein YbjT (DUF2867 family)